MGETALNDVAPPPPGFTLDTPPQGGLLGASKPKRRAGSPSAPPPPPPGFTLDPTGEVVDGDTLRLTDGRNARVWGVDAFETGQPGFKHDGSQVDLGGMARDALGGMVTPQSSLLDTGTQTYGRPVVGVQTGGTDAGRSMIYDGMAMAAPQYLKANPERSADYMETERLARINRRGAHATAYQTPSDYRHVFKLKPDEYLAFADETPKDVQTGYRMSPEQDSAWSAFLADNIGNPNFGPEQTAAWFKAQNIPLGPDTDPRFYEAVRKGEPVGGVSYSKVDAARQGQLDELNAFSGLRPEIKDGYMALSAKGSAAELLAYAKAQGFTLSESEVAKYVRQRDAGKDASLPLPIINPGDGAVGAGARGFVDTPLFGGLEEAGAVVDTLGGTNGRESIWNSDRGFGDVWRNNLRQNDAIVSYDEDKHGTARMIGQIGGGFVIPYGSGVRSVAGLAKLGAAEGGAYAFGSTNGSVGDRLGAVPLGSALGAGAGAFTGKAIELATPLVRRAVSGARSRLARNDGEELAAQAIEAGSDTATDNIPPPPHGFTRDAPMADETPIASIASAPVGKTRPLMADATNVERAAASERIRPSDVLPIPANEVDGVDEAARIGSGLYPAMKAGDPKAVLQTRLITSAHNGARKVPIKGPVDLVTFVRAQGGLREQGGELAHMGLDNSARRMDFAGNEAKVGPLVSDAGQSFDQMGEAAWQAGYFDERPTVSEFLDALSSTHSGNDRRFLPDDYAELDAFNAATEEAHAVGRAAQDGAPLAEDAGQSVTLDDLNANAPPASAYEDWPAGSLEKIGNVRVDKLDTPQDIARALRNSDAHVGGFDAATRGRVTQAETDALATDLGMTADDLLTRRKGQALNAEEALAARRILAKSSNELVNMARRISRMGDEPGTETLAAFRKAWVRHVAIQEQVSGATAEAGRALAQFRMAASSRDHPGRVLEGLVSSAGGSDRIKDVARAVVDLVEDPGTLNKFIADASKPKFSDKIVELWYNSLLSGPQTHVVNMTSNTLTSLAQLPEHLVGATVGAARRAFNQGKADRVVFSEVGARAFGLMQGTKEGLREFARIAKGGESRDFMTKVENQGHTAISGLKGSVIRTPTRLLSAEDELFKAMARRMELGGLAVRNARLEGLKGQAAKDRAAELLANPTDKMMESAFDYGRYVTFTRPLGDAGRKISQITQDWPILKAILPFVRTPSNLIKFSIERSPAAPLLKEVRQELKAGGARRDMAIARVMVGSGFGAMMAEAASKGLITGSAPSDKNKERLLRSKGWQPYSVKVGDKYYSYLRLDPFASTIGTAADLATVETGMSDSQREKGAVLLAASIASNMASKTWLSGLTDFLSALDDPQRNMGWFVKRLAGSAAVPSIVAQTARYMDPTMRESDGAGQYIQSRIPGLSDNLMPKRDVWGQPIAGEGGLGPDALSPMWQSTERPDPITDEALRLGVAIGEPSKNDMSAQDFDKYQEVAGRLHREGLAALMAAPGYAAMPPEAKAKAFDSIRDRARRAAKDSVLGGLPLPPAPIAPSSGRSRGHNAPPPPPPGFTLDHPAPPPGFKLDKPAARRPYAGVDVLGALQKAIPGLRATSGYRDKPYQADMRRRGYHPADNSAHLDGDSLDLLPPSGKGLGWLRARVARQYPGAKLLNEGDHLHATFPGYGRAPALGEAARVGVVNPALLPPPPPGFRLDR